MSEMTRHHCSASTQTLSVWCNKPEETSLQMSAESQGTDVT